MLIIWPRDRTIRSRWTTRLSIIPLRGQRFSATVSAIRGSSGSIRRRTKFLWRTTAGKRGRWFIWSATEPIAAGRLWKAARGCGQKSPRDRPRSHHRFETIIIRKPTLSSAGLFIAVENSRRWTENSSTVTTSRERSGRLVEWPTDRLSAVRWSILTCESRISLKDRLANCLCSIMTSPDKSTSCFPTTWKISRPTFRNCSAKPVSSNL